MFIEAAAQSGELFYTLREAQVLIERWRIQDNTIRPHRSVYAKVFGTCNGAFKIACGGNIGGI